MPHARHWISLACALSGLLLAGPLARAQGTAVSASIVVQPNSSAPASASPRKRSMSPADVVLWLTPLASGAVSSNDAHRLTDPRHPGPFRLVQKDKQFHPHLLVVPTGSNVEFPNKDPFFHNVFSLFNGERFDLGMYESGTTRSVRFDRDGVSYIFCNIHPEMGAVVLSLSTPFYAISGADGAIMVRGVPPGSYRLHVWSETAEAIDPASAQRVVRVSSEPLHLGQIVLRTATDPTAHHKNKFGDDYLPTREPPY